MEKNNPILDELKEISPFVAAIGRQQIYSVPGGYFQGLAIQVMLKIAIEEKAGIDPVLSISKENVYQVPQGYFEGLAGNIINFIKTQEAYKYKADADPVLAITKENAYKVPQGYFDGLAGSIMNRIKAQETESSKEELELLSPLLSQIGRTHPFTSPEGYFNDISDNIIAGVKAIDFVNEELENLSPVMLKLKGKQVYEVPDGYFENTAASFLDKAKHQQPAKVISIGFGKKLVRYAAAAIVVGVIAVAGYFYTGNKPATTLQNPNVPGIAKVSDLEIENFLNNNTVATPGADSTLVTDGDINENDSKDLLANISDEELQQYATDQHLETPITN